MNWIVTQNFAEWVGEQVLIGPFKSEDEAHKAALKMNESHPLVDGEWISETVYPWEDDA
jgi:Arc/MetJ-type ribon-helix-helix transcriptional regulator